MRKNLTSGAFITLSILILATCSIAGKTPFYDKLALEQKISGFAVATKYVDSNGNGIGARFVSERYGFIIDLFNLETSPQAFYWIKTPPKFDHGEPHTCEHLLLGKGNVGKHVAALEEMLLGNSTAYTDQLVTCYHFNTIAGNEAFFELFQAKLNAFLNPDFTDEEIRREVAHIGVTEQEEGKLWIEEKGTVYTEMVSNYEKPWSYLWERMDEMVFGPDHPCANISGGRPDAIRQMVPQDLRDFHKETHILSNMGAIVVLPPELDPKTSLERLEKSLSASQKQATPNRSPSIAVKDLPAPRPTALPGKVVINSAPAESDGEPGEILLSWPADLEYDLNEGILLELFMGNLANGSSSDLYQRLFDSEARIMDLGAGYCWASSSSYPGHPIRFSFGNIDPSHITPEVIDSLKAVVRETIVSIAALSDTSAELKAFNQRALANLSQRKRRYERILDTPPQFGYRGGPAGFWLSHLENLESVGGFEKSITLAPQFDHIKQQIESRGNIWRELVGKWRLTTVQPYVVAIKPDPELLAKIATEKDARLHSFASNLVEKYGVKDEQAALKRFQEEFDEATALIEANEAEASQLNFTETPPLTFDPGLKSSMSMLGPVRVDEFQFDNLLSSTIGLALNLEALPDSLLLYVPFLPSLTSEIGMTIDGKKLNYREVETRLREEVLSFNSYFSTSDATGRAEFVVRASGGNLEEALRAVDWMEAGLTASTLEEANTNRLQDIVAQQLNGVRNRMKGGEEGWVDVPFNAMRLQNNHRYLTASSFLTQTLYLQRLKWRLASPVDPFERSELLNYVIGLMQSGRGKTREEIESILSNQIKLPTSAQGKHAAEELLNDARLMLASVSDENLGLEWEFILGTARADLGYGVRFAIRDLRATLSALNNQHFARIFLISNASNRAPIEKRLNLLVNRLNPAKIYPGVKADFDVIAESVKARGANHKSVYFGLVNPSTNNGLIYFVSSLHDAYDSSPEAVRDALAGRLYGGGGAHGFFMQTWGAGLAYSNGIAYRDGWGSIRYYAERCPDAAETMKFVVSILKEAKPDPALLEYVVALAFGESNSASTYEERGETFANDLADGITPQKVSEFRKAVLQVKKDPKALKDIWSRMGKVYGRVLVGYGAPKQERDGNVFLMIGPEAQFSSMEKLITAEEGKNRPITRIYPGDFWIRD